MHDHQGLNELIRRILAYWTILAVGLLTTSVATIWLSDGKLFGSPIPLPVLAGQLLQGRIEAWVTLILALFLLAPVTTVLATLLYSIFHRIHGTAWSSLIVLFLLLASLWASR